MKYLAWMLLILTGCKTTTNLQVKFTHEIQANQSTITLQAEKEL